MEQMEPGALLEREEQPADRAIPVAKSPAGFARAVPAPWAVCREPRHAAEPVAPADSPATPRAEGCRAAPAREERLEVRERRVAVALLAMESAGMTEHEALMD